MTLMVGFPRIIHAVWIGPKPPPTKLLDTWFALNPAWEFRLWNSDKVQSYVSTTRAGAVLVPSDTPWPVQAQIDQMSELNGRADMMRFCILAKWGGVYVDADEECLLPLDERFCQHEAWACWENETCRPGVVATTVLGAMPGARLFVDLVERIPSCDLRRAAAWETVGPSFLTRVAKDHPELHMFPARHFLPEHYTGTKAPGNAELFGRHHWGNTQAVLTKADVYGRFT